MAASSAVASRGGGAALAGLAVDGLDSDGRRGRVFCESEAFSRAGIWLKKKYLLALGFGLKYFSSLKRLAWGLMYVKVGSSASSDVSLMIGCFCDRVEAWRLGPLVLPPPLVPEFVKRRAFGLLRSKLSLLT